MVNSFSGHEVILKPILFQMAQAFAADKQDRGFQDGRQDGDDGVDQDSIPPVARIF